MSDSPVDDRAGLSRRRFLQALGVVSAGAFVPTVFSAARARATTAPGTAVANGLSFASGSVPFSFRYDGVASSTLLTSWPRTDSSNTSDPTVTRTTITWTQPATGGARLQVRADVAQYTDYPTTEWTVWFTNIGSADSAQLDRVLALDTTVTRTTSQSYLVHTLNGSVATGRDFAPWSYAVEPSNSSRAFFCGSGRPTEGGLNPASSSGVLGGGWPYYNVDLGDGHGFIVALGWPGHWGLQMRREGTDRGMHLVGGMSGLDAADWTESTQLEDAALLNTYLHAGEDVRTPLMVWQQWAGTDWIAAQNTWRAWMLTHNKPAATTTPPLPMSPTGVVCGYYPGLLDSASDELDFLADYDFGSLAGQGGVSDYWWMDAGWYDTRVNGTGSETGWTQTGTWVPSPARYPAGLAPVTNQARTDGMRSIVWHEPERVAAGSELANDHPDWLLPAGDYLLDLGNPAALSWAKSTFSSLIGDNGVDVYRQDFNINYPYPLLAWNTADTTGRSGMRQARHVMGLLDYWDTLLADYPMMFMDTCASGGRRLDLETLRRAFPLDRSDKEFEPLSQQGQTYGLASWVPYFGTGIYPDQASTYGDAPYVVRSSFAPALVQAIDPRGASTANQNFLLQMQREWSDVAPYLLGDYYPLTTYSGQDDSWSSDSVWMAYQFDRPEIGQGAVLLFRRPSATSGSYTLALRGITSSATYLVTDYQAGTQTSMSGSALAGLTVSLAAGTSTILRYWKDQSYAAVVAAEGPVGWWRLGEAASSSTVADSSGHGQTGSVGGGTTLGVAGAIAGDSNTAAAFDGSSGVIDLGNPSQLRLTSGSVEAWIKTTDHAYAAQAIAIKWYAYGLFLSYGKPYIYDWTTAAGYYADLDVADNTWHHVVLTFQSGLSNGTHVYVDGELVLTCTTTVANNANHAIIGAGDIPADQNFFSGRIDEVAYYGQVLTQAQIRRHHAAGI